MMDKEGTVVHVFSFRGSVEEHSVVVADGDDCVKANMYVRGGVLLVWRSCRR